MKHLSLSAIIIVLAVLILGCSGSPGGSPVVPDMPDSLTTTGDGAPVGTSRSTDIESSHALWGLWQGEFNPETREFDLVLLREAQFHVNVVGQLQSPKPPGLAIDINSLDVVAGTIDVDLTVIHPFPGSNLRGFDVRGILMGAGDTLQSTLDAGIIYAAPDGLRLENADGFTRWWNAVEFTTPGLYGFVPGDLGFKFFTPQATLNPYKYFADVLLPGDPVVPKVQYANRGTFSTDATPPMCTRNYRIQFPMGATGKPIWLFQYAIDASWAPPTGSSPPPKPVSDYPIEANCPEAFHIEVDTAGTTAWYIDDGNLGGNLIMAIEVFDWRAATSPDGIAGEIASVFIESETLFGGIESVDLTPGPGSQPTSGVFSITVLGVTPADLEDQEVLITVRSQAPASYVPPVTGPDYPSGASLAAYKLVEIPISNIQPQDAVITVTKPNGGEEWVAGGSGEITWTSEGPVGNFVSIGYAISGGAVMPITSSTANDGSFTWNPLPAIESQEVKVKISSVVDPGVWDESDGYFSITSTPPPHIIVTEPNGGEIWLPGDAEHITWDSIGDVGFEVRIEYTISDGTPVEIVPFTDNDGDFLWVPIPDIESEEVRVIVTSIDDPLIYDESDDYFTITSNPDPTIFVLIPNGGEVWESGDPEEITWDWVGDVGFEVRIDYSIEDGPPVNIISTTTNDGSFMWDPIPAVDSQFVRVIVSSFINPSVYDESDDYFTIEPPIEPELTVVVPNGGEVWEAGSSEETLWTSVGPVGDFVKLEYVVSFGMPVEIVDSTENDGSFTWNPIPAEDSSEVVVIVTSIDDPGVFDQSDGFFSILPYVEPEIVVMVPNGGEVWYAGTAEEITWTSQGSVGNFVKIDYTLSDSLLFPVIDSTDNDGSFTWDPISDVESSEVRIRVTSIDLPGVLDASDEYFTITTAPEPRITVVIPNGGEVWYAGAAEEITWTSQGAVGDFVKIDYTLSDSLLFPVIASTENDGSYTWDPILDIESSEVRIRITSIDLPGVLDASDEYFTISEPESITVLSPNGGEELSGGGTWETTWDWTGDVDFVKLLLSTDSGGTWPTTIVESTDCDGSFDWDPIPEIDTSTARIRAEWVSQPSVADESDGDFTITTGPPTGWLPVPGQTQVALTSPTPNQGIEPPDLTLYSLGDDASRGEIVDEADDNSFWTYWDDYSGNTGASWDYADFVTPLHKFDVRHDGQWIFVANANSDSWPADEVNDPAYCLYTCNDNSTGATSDGYWHFYGDSGDPDPDAYPWRRMVDFSCGVPGGIDDTTSYHLVVVSDHASNPQPHDGNILIGAWDAPYDNSSLTYWLVDSSTQGGGTGYVDDTNPGLMALAADDDTDLVFDPEPIVGLWILDSAGIVTCHAIAFATGDLAIMDDQLDSDEYGTATPVDVEIAPATEFGYEVTDPGFNWLVALLDNGDGTWSVGVWEFDYLADPVEFVEIDITAPLAGTPLAMDVDGHDFEIHVLADNGGTIEVTVFDYTP